MTSIIDNCGICRDELVSSLTTLECKHVFHTKCIDAWTERVSTCPFCRHPIGTPPKTIIQLVEYGMFEDEQELVECIHTFGISTNEVISLIRSKHLSRNGITNLIMERCLITSDIKRIVDEFIND